MGISTWYREHCVINLFLLFKASRTCGVLHSISSEQFVHRLQLFDEFYHLLLRSQILPCSNTSNVRIIQVYKKAQRRLVIPNTFKILKQAKTIRIEDRKI